MNKFEMDFISLKKGKKLLSPEIGIIKGLGKVSRMLWDPLIYSYRIISCNSTILQGEFYGGRSGGAGYNLKEAIETTLREVVERYCGAFYDKSALKKENIKISGTKLFILKNSPFLIFLPFHLDENRIGYSTSTGMAGHYNFYKAFLIGLYEIIERDAFVITWFQELNVPKIVISEK